MEPFMPSVSGMNKMLDDCVVVICYSSGGAAVYSKIVTYMDFLSVKQPWDNFEAVRRFGITRLRALVFSDGWLTEDLEMEFSPENGMGRIARTQLGDGQRWEYLGKFVDGPFGFDEMRRLE